MANKFGQGYRMEQRPSHAEELDQRFGMMVLKMKRGVEAFQANDHATSKRIKAELDAEINALDSKVQRELANYVRTLILDELVPAATLHYAGPIGRSYQRLAKLALQAKLLGLKVDPYRFRDSVVALPEALDAMAKDFASKGLFDRARRSKALASQIREATPKAWLASPKSGQPEATGSVENSSTLAAEDAPVKAAPVESANAAHAAETTAGNRRIRS